MAMTVQCPECRTEFPVDLAKVPEEGVRAQCSACPGIFPVFRPEDWKASGSEMAARVGAVVEDVIESAAGAVTGLVEEIRDKVEEARDKVEEAVAREEAKAEEAAAMEETATVEETVVVEEAAAETEEFVESFETLDSIEFEAEVQPGDADEVTDVFEAPDAPAESPVDIEPVADLDSGLAEETQPVADAEFDSYFERTFEGDDLPQIGTDDELPEPGDGIGTLEQSLEEARQGFAEPEGGEAAVEEAGAFTVDSEGLEVTDLSGGLEAAPETDVAPEPVAEAEPAVEAEPAAETEPAAAAAPIQFGKRDPHEKAKRLARVLVSDMIVYHRDKHAQSLQAGTLKDDFADEVEKSIEEYVDQVGQEIHDTTDYFRQALNEILAKGQEVF
jgi:predicted Zn finger-like uncharacterized protein